MLSLVFVTSFFVVLLATPSLIRVARLKHLFDEPGDERKLHKKRIPTIGGIIIFAGTLFSYALWYPGYSPQNLQFVVAVGLLLFFVGIKDDIIGIAPVKKLWAHVIVGFILVLMADVRITSLHGVFGIRDIPEWASIFLSLFTYIVIVNAFNLIDGVDGLAAGVGLIASMAFAFWFYLANEMVMASLAMSLGGALLAFLIFNFSPAKIFMGDSGSLTIGVLYSILSIKMIEYPSALMPNSIVNISKPILALAILAYPLADTLRIFMYRMVRGMSPFTADRNHIHHQLLDFGLSHKQVVMIVYLFTILIIGLAVALQDIDSTQSFIIISGIAMALTQVPYFLKKKNNKKHKPVEEQAI